VDSPASLPLPDQRRGDVGQHHQVGDAPQRQILFALLSEQGLGRDQRRLVELRMAVQGAATTKANSAKPMAGTISHRDGRGSDLLLA
jgi:hypothetical protein